MTERELMLTGIGGQGVQLAGQVLARASTLEGRHVTYFGVYSGVMRGGNTDATVVVSDVPIESPPVVSRTWSAIAMHHEFWEPLRPRLRDDAVVLLNTTVFDADPALGSGHRRVDVPATERAGELGNLMLASMVIVGAYVALTGLVGIDATVEGMREAIPPYRSQHVPANEEALRAGYEMVEVDAAPAWSSAPLAAGSDGR